MDSTILFNPFTDRQSRDIRNSLSSSLVECLEQGSDEPAQLVANSFLQQGLSETYTAYIEDRIERYKHAIDQIYSTTDDPFMRSVILWDLELFFEMHEVLEHSWYNAVGDEKLLMQALIRAAGVYIKLRYGMEEAAERMALKALPIIESQQGFLVKYFPPEILINGLQDLALPAPKLLQK